MSPPRDAARFFFASLPAAFAFANAASLLLRRDLRRDKLPDGRPLLELAEKVWALILDGYEEQLPPHLQSEVRDAESDESPNKDSSAIIASAEAILRSEQGERTREDLPPTEA